MEERVKYKCCCLCFKMITGSASAYLSDLLQVYVPSRTLRSSADTRLFRVPKFRRVQHGHRAFSHSAATTWNSLPFAVRHTATFSAFKAELKTFLFQKYFYWSGHIAAAGVVSFVVCDEMKCSLPFVLMWFQWYFSEMVSVLWCNRCEERKVNLRLFVGNL